MNREALTLTLIFVLMMLVGGYFFAEHYSRIEAIDELIKTSANNEISEVSGGGIRERIMLNLISGDYWLRFKSPNTPILKEPAKAAYPPLEDCKSLFPSDAKSLPVDLKAMLSRASDSKQSELELEYTVRKAQRDILSAREDRKEAFYEIVKLCGNEARSILTAIADDRDFENEQRQWIIRR